jgi:murein DD-endopeptidase MepM/ murein hydrolase activator NlpD
VRQGFSASQARLSANIAGSIVAAFLAFAPLAPVRAGEAALPSDSVDAKPPGPQAVGDRSGAAAIVGDEWEPAQITVSNAADGGGRRVYGHRASFSGSAGVVTFSSRPPSFTGSARPALSAATIGQLPRHFPVVARALTSGFGLRRHPVLGELRRHSGVDLAAPHGTPIAATADGAVMFANWSGGYGLLVALDHGGGIETRYGHMSRIAVAPGQRVRIGDLVGYVGSTGLSTGPHVHYEVRVNGAPVNPYANLRGR